MAFTVFVPEIWTARLLRHLDASLVHAQPSLTNRNFEGEISKYGDTVHIQKVGNPTIKAYVTNTDMAAPERPDGTDDTLTIDEQAYFNVAIDDVNAVQAKPAVFDAWCQRAGRKMAEEVDSAVAAVKVAGAGIDIGTAADPTTIGNSGSEDYTFYELCVEARRLLDNNDAPTDGRWIVIPPDVEATVLLDPQFIVAGADAQRTGLIGRVAGFDVLKTTAVPTIEGTGGANDSWGVLFGAGNYATTHANQLIKLEAYRIEKQFGDALKGLNVWGTDVLEPETLGCVLVDKGA
jgi:N4-gp56 family major capsid protein